jgi:hypothetical protein
MQRVSGDDLRCNIKKIQDLNFDHNVNIGVGSPKAINNTYYRVKFLNIIGNNLENGEHLQQNVSIEKMLGESMKYKATHDVDNSLKLSLFF